MDRIAAYCYFYFHASQTLPPGPAIYNGQAMGQHASMALWQLVKGPFADYDVGTLHYLFLGFLGEPYAHDFLNLVFMARQWGFALFPQLAAGYGMPLPPVMGGYMMPHPVAMHQQQQHQVRLGAAALAHPGMGMGMDMNLFSTLPQPNVGPALPMLQPPQLQQQLLLPPPQLQQQQQQQPPQQPQQQQIEQPDQQPEEQQTEALTATEADDTNTIPQFEFGTDFDFDFDFDIDFEPAMPAEEPQLQQQQEQQQAQQVADPDDGGTLITCPICNLPLDDGSELSRFMDPCGHCFHVSCQDEWARMSTQCAICRVKVEGNTEQP